MKQKQAICFLICTALLFMNPIIHTSAMDGFDMINNMNMDMVLEQSYHTINSVEFATDHAMDNNILNHQLNEIMFFPDLLDVISTNAPANSTSDNIISNDIIVAVDNGAWMPEFNNFFNNPTAEIPMDIEMMNVDMDSVMVPAFQFLPQQDTIGDLNNSPNMNPFNDDPVLNNTSELEATVPDTFDNLNWNMETNPETALLDVAQPEGNTHMLEAPGGEILDDEFNNMPKDDNQNTGSNMNDEKPISEPSTE